MSIGLPPEHGADAAFALSHFDCAACDDTGVTFAGRRCNCAYAYRADANGLVGDSCDDGSEFRADDAEYARGCDSDDNVRAPDYLRSRL